MEAPAGGVIDTHAHLDALRRRRRRRSSRARARRASTRIVTVGTGIDSCRAALELAERARRASSRRSASTRTRRAATDAERSTSSRELLAHDRGGRRRRDRARLLPRLRAARRAARALRGAARARRRARASRSSIHTRAADDDTLARARAASTAPSSCTASRRRDLLDAGARARLLRLVRRQRRPTRTRTTSAPRRAQVPADRILAETDCPYLAPQPRRGRPNEPANVVHTLAALAEARGEDAGRARARRSTPTRAAAFGAAVSRSRRAEARARPALPRRREHPRRDRAPRRARARRRRARDRPGPRRPDALPRRARRARPRGRARPRRSSRTCASARARERRARASATRCALDLAALEPPPTKLVANLPYNVATPLVVESLDGLPTRRALVRDGAARGRRPLLRRAGDEGVRRRVGARPARRRADGLPPGLAHVFRPRPNVDSALVAFRRTAAAAGLRGA